MDMTELGTSSIVALVLDQPTINGRIYTKEEMEKTLKDPILQEKLKSHSLFLVNYEKDYVGEVPYDVPIDRVVGTIDNIYIDHQDEFDFDRVMIDVTYFDKVKKFQFSTFVGMGDIEVRDDKQYVVNYQICYGLVFEDEDKLKEK